MNKFITISLAFGALAFFGASLLSWEKVKAGVCFTGTSGSTTFNGGPCVPSACYPSVCIGACGDPSATVTSCVGDGGYNCIITCSY